MQEVGTDHALLLVRSWFPEPDNLFWLLSVLRREEPAFVPTFLSAHATRSSLPIGLAAEVDLARTRLARLRRIQGVIQAQVPDVIAVKGLAVADAYPPGLTRRTGDLDLVAPDEPAVWQIAHVASVEFGLTVRSVLAFPARTGGVPGRGVMVNLVARPTPTFDEPISLDVSTHALIGNGTTVPAWRGPAPRPPGPAEHLLMITAERLEQSFGLKDIFDASVLAGELARDGDGALMRARELIGHAHLLPELAELFDLATRHCLPLPAAARPLAGQVRRARAKRGLHLVATAAAHPVQAPLHSLQRAEVLPSRAARLRRRLWHAVDRRLPVGAPVRSELFRFGMLVQVSGETDRPLLRSPLGDYLLVNGAEISEAWLDHAVVPTAGPEEGPSVFDAAWSRTGHHP